MNEQMGGMGWRAVSPPILIDPMTVEDLPQVMAIEKVSFPTPFSENLFRMELNLNIAHLFVVRQGKEVLGYIDYWHVGGEIHVITLAVHPDFRKHGIGTFLIRFLLEQAKKESVKAISLDVRPSNTAALALYRKFGFQEAGLRKQYYQDTQEDALILSLTL